MYDGGWNDANKHGRGFYSYGSGSKYDGEWKYGNEHGHGIYTYATGAKYEGEWKDGNMHGHGVYISPDGDKYDGEWKNGGMNGHGVYCAANGDNYDGDWKDDKKHGHGVYTFADGDTYRGHWKAGNEHGHGVFTSASGSKFDGEWKDGKKHGRGVYTTSRGNEFLGMWDNGDRIFWIPEKDVEIIKKRSSEGRWARNFFDIRKSVKEVLEEPYVRTWFADEATVNLESIRSARSVIFKCICEGLISQKANKRNYQCLRGFIEDFWTDFRSIVLDFSEMPLDLGMMKICCDAITRISFVSEVEKRELISKLEMFLKLAEN
eukprot:TRINITY_DN43822_c0_g1_i1.p1 TRINITY_DN43822_c0_g1~~TRINITY_DN43822_c0_g1_i1.p1  ORF type:complete len:353 (+),score=72.64 TRINITY_DN43822_c0_g1_i1:104-1060(+)